MFDLICKLVRLKTVDSVVEINRAIDICIDYFNEIKSEIVLKKINNEYPSVLISNSDNVDVLSTCHIDVIPMQTGVYDLLKRDNILYGRGVFDMKSFLVSALFNLKKIIKQKINVKYGILIVANEETTTNSDTALWINKINPKIILDSDSGNGNINRIIKDNFGSATIKLSKKDKSTIKSIEDVFSKYYFNVVDDEIDLMFCNSNVQEELQNCMKNETNFEFLMFNDYIQNRIHNKNSVLYKKIAEKYLKTNIEYMTSKTTTDSRFFSNKNVTIISHQSNGGDYHKPSEWLDHDSFLLFNNIQFEFLKIVNF